MTKSKETYFNIDARILFQLGEQLVTDRAVALAELIKNSYDADASIVKVIMNKVVQPGGYILIQDNGEGINRIAFEENWMRIATIDKEKNPISQKYGRKKAGEKGIGRFSCRRLSKTLLIKSVSANENGKKVLLSATFNWEKFRPGDDLIKIPINYSTEIIDDDAQSGTSLYLKDTLDSWKKADIKKLRLELLDLFTPDTFIRGKKKTYFEDDPGFNVEFEIPDFPDKMEALDNSFYKNAWAELKGEIDENGNSKYDITFKNIYFKNEKNEYIRSENYQYIKNVHLKCFIFSYKPEFFGASEFGMNKAQNIGRERGGIKLYSDRFRIFGYGRPGDDWLKVDYDRARSVSSVDSEIMDFREEKSDRPGLRIFQNRNLFGHVIFDKDENPLLEITVNRDSLIENEAFVELRHFTRLGIDFATVLYSNIVHNQQEIEKEKKRQEEENERKLALEEKRKLEEQKKKAEAEAKLSDERRIFAERRAKEAEEAKYKAEEARRKAERDRLQAEEARLLAEKARFEAEKENANKDERQKRIIEEKNAQLLAEKRRKEEKEAILREELARKRADEENQNAKEEEQKKRALEEELKRKKELLENEDRKNKEQENKLNEKRLEEERVLLRVLASTGTMMLIFQHELQGITEEMETILINFRRSIAGKGDKFLEDLIEDHYTQVEMVKELGTLMGSIINSESRLQKKDWVLLPIAKCVIKPFTNYIEKVGAEIDCDIPDHLRTPIMYRSELISVLHNLITNSIKAIRTTKKKHIKIYALDNKSNFILQVLDTGKGLEKEKWIEVFSPFVSYSEPDLRFGTGTGLGLKIVRDIIMSYNGTIKFIEPPADWKTCIEIKLPIG
jgi:signal transduction histidine kinase